MINFDENTWTCFVPGAKLGLRRIFTLNSEKDELPVAQRLTKIMDYGLKALGLQFPYLLNRKLPLKTIEHPMFEYDNYFRSATIQSNTKRQFHSRCSLDTYSCLECVLRGSLSRVLALCV